VLGLIKQSDALIEGFRPGVMEKLGLGPDICLKQNPKLVYGRMTGWGQDGPLAHAAGHDINYIALTGALHAIGPADGNPVPPLNLIGDFGGGGMLLAFGIACGLFYAQRTGEGQVVDAAMVDGAASLMSMFYGIFGMGFWKNKRESNVIDGGAHFYGTYETSDGKFVAIGSIEPQFYALLLKHGGIKEPEFDNQMDVANWPFLKTKIAEIFKHKTRDEWCKIMEGTDVCFAPVLDFTEVAEHPHNKKRQTFIEIDGVLQPAPAPRFSKTPPQVQRPPAEPGEHTESALMDWGVSKETIDTLRTLNVI